MTPEAGDPPAVPDGDYDAYLAWAGTYGPSTATFTVQVFALSRITMSGGTAKGTWSGSGTGTIVSGGITSAATVNASGDVGGDASGIALSGFATITGAADGIPFGFTGPVGRPNNGISLRADAAQPRRAYGDWTFQQLEFLDGPGYSVNGTGSWLALERDAAVSRLVVPANAYFAEPTLPLDRAQLSALLDVADATCRKLPQDRTHARSFVGPLAVAVQSLLQRALLQPSAFSDADFLTVTAAAYRQATIGSGSVLPGADKLESATTAELQRRGLSVRPTKRVSAGVDGRGAQPRFWWSRVRGATLYRVQVNDAHGRGYWAWEGTPNAVVLGGGTGSHLVRGAGPIATKGDSWDVVAYDRAGNAIAASRPTKLA
jgi:hypothetical protein